MAEPLKSTSDVPTYDTYPAPSPQEPGIRRPGEESPGWQAEHSERRLSAAAERLGSAVGEAVGAVRRRLEVVPRRIDEAKERLTETGVDMREDIRAAATEWKETAQHRLYEARLRTRRYVNENPFQVLGAAALLGFAVGVGLRIWRWRNE